MRLLLVILFLGSTCHAQEFKKVKIGFGLGYPTTWAQSNGGTNNPVVVNFEPSYRINDKAIIGLRMEFASRENVAIRSEGLFTQYYLSDKQFRPFVGLGISFFRPSTTYHSNNESYYTINMESKIGFYPRVGFDYGHLTITFDYNVAGVSKTTVINQNSGSSSLQELSSNYSSIKLGFFIGGGRKK